MPTASAAAYVHLVSGLWSLTRKIGVDVLIAIAAGISALEVIVNQGEVSAPESPTWFAAMVSGLLVLLLVVRRWFPFGAPVSLWLAAAGLSFIDGRLIVFSATLFAAGAAAAYLLGNLRDSFQAQLGLAVVIGGGFIVVYNNPDHEVGQFLATPCLFVIIWLAGFGLRRRVTESEAAEERMARLEREREDEARLAVAEERARIARELHDVVGHCVSVMTVQSSAVRRLLRADQEKERAALLTVEQAGREALVEMRRLVSVLRTAETQGAEPSLAPLPGLSLVPKLVSQAIETGLSVRLRVEGDPVPLPASIDLAAYRLVQEGLTNTIKHAYATSVDVLVRYAADEVEVEVSDDGRGANGRAADGGHGLVGMRERVGLFGGRLEAGPGRSGGYRLRAMLPTSR
jgi:signal transduction histidine kinase